LAFKDTNTILNESMAVGGALQWYCVCVRGCACACMCDGDAVASTEMLCEEPGGEREV
jgi:hypothetical protein